MTTNNILFHAFEPIHFTVNCRFIKHFRRFLEQQVVDKLEFMEENDRIWGKKVVIEGGDSQTMQPGQIVTARKLRDENSMLKRRDLKLVEVRDAI
ncbi:hypothetical protein EZS27_036597, partial [termite gut metagenome]